jgi:hypothetical protein
MKFKLTLHDELQKSFFGNLLLPCLLCLEELIEKRFKHPRASLLIRASTKFSTLLHFCIQKEQPAKVKYYLKTLDYAIFKCAFDEAGESDALFHSHWQALLAEFQ